MADAGGTRRVNAANSTTDVTSDARVVNLALGATPGSSKWDPNADLNRDGVVNVYDRAVVSGANGRRVIDRFGGNWSGGGGGAGVPDVGRLAATDYEVSGDVGDAVGAAAGVTLTAFGTAVRTWAEAVAGTLRAAGTWTGTGWWPRPPAP